MSATKKRIPIYIVAALAVVLIVGTVIAMSMNREEPLSADELLSLGEKYLLDLDYEQALVQFLKVIEIEPMNPRGYTGAAESYIGLGHNTEAIAILEHGLSAMPDDEAIKAMLGGLTSESELNPEIEPDSKEEDAEAEPVNLTGKEPFNLQDLEEWGFPYGISIWDVQTTFNLETDQINQAIQNLEEYTIEEIKSRSISSGVLGSNESLMVSVTENERLGHIAIRRANTFLSNGPRGIEIGMHMRDVMSLFMVQHNNAFDDITPYELARLVDYLYIDGEKFARIAPISKNGTPHGAYLQYFISSDPTNLHDSKIAALTCEISNEGLVTWIGVSYI